MKVIGLTGGIGSGKTSVAKLFQQKGVPIYFSDNRAKELMNHSDIIRSELIKEYGTEVYINNILNSKLVASIVFNDKEKLKKLNQLVHPVVFNDFEEWKTQQRGRFVIKEAAILFESGSHKTCDKIIVVTAPEETRIKRVMLRDKVLESQVKARLKNQWPEDKKLALADYIINNNKDYKHLEREVHRLYNIIKHTL